MGRRLKRRVFNICNQDLGKIRGTQNKEKCNAHQGTIGPEHPPGVFSSGTGRTL